MRNQQQRHNERGNEIGSSQLPGQETGVIGLVESVQDIDGAPEIEDPCDDTPMRPGASSYLAKSHLYR